MSRGAKAAWILGAAALAVAVAAGAFVQVSVNESFDAAVAEMDAATEVAQAAGESLQGVIDDGAAALAASEAIVAVARDDLVDGDARAMLADAAATSSNAVDEADALLSEPVRLPTTEKPLWPWEILSGTERLEAGAARLEALAVDLQAAQDAIEDADEALVESAVALYVTVPPRAVALEAANISARHYAVLDLRDAADAVAGQTRVGSGAVSALRTYAEKATQLAASAAAELAEKAGPLYDTRLEIEAFARSIAGGVVLDFDWAPLVNGLGGDAGMSGTARWNADRGGFSTITLSDSVAEQWPSPDAQALVAHEVGHAITAKCHEMFDSDDADANEAWATAWAISMGHTATGNGVQAYGYPPQHLIDTAMACR